MKKIGIILIVLASFFNSGISQNVNQKLLVKYDKIALEKMELSNPIELEYLNLYVTEGYYIGDMPEKYLEYTKLQKINIETGEPIENYIITEKDLLNFNPLDGL